MPEAAFYAYPPGMEGCTDYINTFLLFANLPAIAAGMWVFLRLEKRADAKYGKYYGNNMLTSGKRRMADAKTILAGVATYYVTVYLFLNSESFQSIFLCM